MSSSMSSGFLRLHSVNPASKVFSSSELCMRQKVTPSDGSRALVLLECYAKLEHL